MLLKNFHALSHFDLHFQPSCAGGRADVFDILQINIICQYVVFSVTDELLKFYLAVEVLGCSWGCFKNQSQGYFRVI